MLPEPANCPLCKAAAERVRSSLSRGFKYTCPSCGSFDVDPAALTQSAEFPSTVRDDVQRLRAFGHFPRVELTVREGVRVVPSRG